MTAEETERARKYYNLRKEHKEILHFDKVIERAKGCNFFGEDIFDFLKTKANMRCHQSALKLSMTFEKFYIVEADMLNLGCFNAYAKKKEEPECYHHSFLVVGGKDIGSDDENFYVIDTTLKQVFERTYYYSMMGVANERKTLSTTLKRDGLYNLFKSQMEKERWSLKKDNLAEIIYEYYRAVDDGRYSAKILHDEVEVLICEAKKYSFSEKIFN